MLRKSSNSSVEPLRLVYHIRISESNFSLTPPTHWFIHQLYVAVSSEEERVGKLKSQTKAKPAYATQIGQEAAESREVPSSKVLTVKKDPNLPNRAKTELQELKAEVEALKTDVNSRSEGNAQPRRQGGNSWSYGRGWERREAIPRPSKCQSCFEKGEERCNDCYKCGSGSHYAIGCRQGQSPGQRLLNERRLLGGTRSSRAATCVPPM